MKWQDFIKYLKTLGYEGDGDDFAEVQTWLGDNGHDTDKVDGKDGAEIALKGLFDARPGKKLDVTTAMDQAARQAEIDDQISAGVASAMKRMGYDRANDPDRTTQTHDVKVGRDRLAEDPKGGFKHFGEFCNAVRQHVMDETQTPEKLSRYYKATLATYASEGTGADGGFAVPTEWRDEIMVKVTGEDSILSRCDQIPLSKNGITIPYDETTPWGSSGIQHSWEGEATAFNQRKPVLTMKELRLRKVTCLVPVTEELLEDSVAIGSYIGRKAGEVLDFAIGEAIFRGTGAGQPFGFMNSGAMISITKQSSQGADTIVGANVLKMWGRLYGPYRRTAVWFINQSAESDLLRLSILGRKDSGGSSTSYGGFLYMPPGGLSGQSYGTLFGRPVIITEHCEALGDAGDIILADMKQYVCAVKSSGVESASSIHLWFDQDTVAFRFRMRIDGQPWSNSTISPRDTSANAMSAFVQIAARA